MVRNIQGTPYCRRDYMTMVLKAGYDFFYELKLRNVITVFFWD